MAFIVTGPLYGPHSRTQNFCDKNGNPVIFKDMGKAKELLALLGYSEADIEIYGVDIKEVNFIAKKKTKDSECKENLNGAIVNLLDRLIEETDKDSFDVSIAEGLSGLLGPYKACALLTANQRDVVVDCVEMSLDCSEDVSAALFALYNFIIEKRRIYS